MAKIPDDQWDITYEELKREADHQINEHERYQRQAALFLRISLATFGVVLTALSLGASGPILTEALVVLSPQEIQSLVQRLVKSGASDMTADVLVPALSIASIIYLSLAIFEIAIRIPSNAYLVAYPNQFFPGLSTLDVRRIDAKDGLDTREETVKRYREVIIHNRNAVRKTRNRLSKCFDSAKRGILYSGGAISGIYALSTGQMGIISLVSGLVVSTLIYVSWNSVSLDRHSRYFLPNPEFFSFLLLFLVVAQFKDVDDAMFVIFVVSLLILPISAYYLGINRVDIGIGQIILVLGTAVGYLLLKVLVDPQAKAGVLEDLAINIAFGTGTLLVSGVIVSGLYEAIQYIKSLYANYLKNRVERLKEEYLTPLRLQYRRK